MLNNVASAGTGCSCSFPLPLIVVVVVALCWLIKRPRQLAQTVKLLNAHGVEEQGRGTANEATMVKRSRRRDNDNNDDEAEAEPTDAALITI